MRQPFDRIARELADLFVRAVDNQSIGSVVLETELVRRESA
jgi:DNA-binding LacI/PurR family transcriptional regulator